MTAAISLIGAVLTLSMVGQMSDAYRDVYAGTEAAGSEAVLVGISVLGVVVNILFAAGLAILSIFNNRGRNGARITTWVLGGIALCCSGLGLAGTAFTNSMNLDAAGTGGGPSPAEVRAPAQRGAARPGTTPVVHDAVGDLAAGHPGRGHPAGAARVERVLPQAGRRRWDPSMPYPYTPSGQSPYPQTGQPPYPQAGQPAGGQPPYPAYPPSAPETGIPPYPTYPPSGSARRHRRPPVDPRRRRPTDPAPPTDPWGRPAGDDDRRPPSGPTT